MRSDLVFGAIAKVSNRYLLTKLASKAVRGMHIPFVRIEDATKMRYSCTSVVPTQSDATKHSQNQCRLHSAPR
jgi:hypothetical protein